MSRRFKTGLIAAVTILVVGLLIIAMVLLQRNSGDDALVSNVEKIGPEEAAYADGTVTVASREDSAAADTQAQAAADSEKEAEELISKIQAETLTIQITDGVTDTISPDTISSWVSRDGTTVSVDDGAIATYVASIASSYDTWGKQISFTTHSGNTISLGAVNYGWKLNQETTASDIHNAVLAGESATVPVTWSSKEAVTGTNGVGTTYIEADLDEQHLYVYKNGSVVISSDLVSGRAIKNWCTPNGVFEIVGMQKDAVLKGENYETPVSYWMPFYLGWGFHDASWRSAFGGDIYVSSGSHGCCNLPPSVAKQLFNTIYAGEPVIVYGGMSQSQAEAYLAQKSEEASTEATSDENSGEADSSEAATTADSAELAQAQQIAAALGMTLDDQQAAIIVQAMQNYEAVGMTPEQAAAQVQSDLQSQLTTQQSAATSADPAADAAAAASTAAAPVPGAADASAAAATPAPAADPNAAGAAAQ